ncbi:hypothetical protein [Luteolibacter sp. LG18]|uniref:hypothetical protein n=1 Tax=Luteolibacter sp. LG18 TaxID=2819286 RepID=UPI002B30C29C|nr:hypothetical protein llg_27710 [Luteolibacter sp. LG18]
MNPIPIVVRWSLSALACLLCAAGQARAVEEPVASIQMLAFSYSGPERSVLVADPKGVAQTKEPVALPTNQCSPLLRVTSRNLVITPVMEGQGGKQGKPAKVTLPEGGREFVLVFLPIPDDQGGGYRIQAVDLPAERFKSGSYAFLNYSDTEIYCGLDNQKTIVAPAKAGILSPQRAEGIVRAACYEKSGEGWGQQPFFSGRVPVQDGVRNLVLVSRNPQNNRIDFRGVADYVTP